MLMDEDYSCLQHIPIRKIIYDSLNEEQKILFKLSISNISNKNTNFEKHLKEIPEGIKWI